MIANTGAMAPQLDSAQLRRVAEHLDSGLGLDSLAKEFSLTGAKDLLAGSARALGLEWIASDHLEVASEAPGSPEGTSGHDPSATNRVAPRSIR